MAILIEYTLKAKEDIDHFKSSGQTQILKKIRGLVEAISENPYIGIGKPEPLRHNLQGLWSRRINSEHRIVYEIEDQMVFILSCRGHY
jgi:toxin YoeB